MAGKKNKKSQRTIVTPNDFYWEHLMSWLGNAQPAPGGWGVLLQELQTLLASLLKEKNAEQRLGYFERALTVLFERFAEMSGTPQEIEVQLKVGQAYENLGAWDHALVAYQRAIALCDALRFIPQKSQALRWAGNVYSKQNLWQQAEQAYQESLQLCIQAGDVAGQAQAANSLGILCFEQGELAQATARWEQALELAEKAHAENLIAVIYNNLGALANVQGRWDQALSYYGESLPRFEATGDTSSMASTYHNLAMSYADNASWAEASIYYEKSFRLAQQLGDVHLQTLVKLNRVELYLAIGDAALAEVLCLQVLQAYQRMHDHLGEADACKFLGMINAKKRAWTKAKRHFEKSIRLALEFHHPLGEAEARWEYGRMLKQKGATQNAREQYEQALALFRKVNARVEVEKVQREIKSYF